MNEPPRRTMPIGTYLVLALASGLYVAMLLNVQVPAGGGEARIANAYQVLFLTLWLWIALAVLLGMRGVMGEMPRWLGSPLSSFIRYLVSPLSSQSTWPSGMAGQSFFQYCCRC